VGVRSLAELVPKPSGESLSTIRLTHAPSGSILAEGPKGFSGVGLFVVVFALDATIASDLIDS
jgi:hypothetical protein